VACAVSYPQIKPGEKANDYVLVCEDTDGDGRADQFHKFVEGLFMPSGLELGDGGLYVAQGTELLHFRDTDGDGRADASRIVLGGFGTADSHQMINCINWGFGGELWFTQGHHIYSRVETPHGVETLNRAGVWRFRPRTVHLDPFFQWSSAGANCWGVVTTDYGQPFHKSGANIGGYFSTPGLVRSSLAVTGQPMNLFLAPIKQVGMDFIGSAHFPDDWQGRVIIGGYYGNTLEQHELTLTDGVYESKLLPNIIETTNNVFRPVEIRNGPDGAIYVADWYNPIIGHYQASYRHPDRDKEHGRIWRVRRTDRDLVRPPKLGDMSIPELLEQLNSPERWVKYQAKRLLFSAESNEVVAALDAWVGGLKAGNETDEYLRLQALSLYEAHETPRPELLRSLLRSNDARIRAYATRTLSTWARDGRLDEALVLLEDQIVDEDPLVRLEAIVAASYVPDPKAAVVAARAMDMPFNAYHDHALTKALHATHGLWGTPLTQGKLEFERDEHLLFALKKGWVENDPQDLKASAQAAASDRAQGVKSPTKTARGVAAILRKQAVGSQDDRARLVLWLKALAEIAGPDDMAFLMKHGGRRPEVLNALAAAGPTGRLEEGRALAWIRPLLSADSPALRQAAMRLAGAWKLTALKPDLLGVAAQPDADLAVRRTAVTAVGQMGGSSNELAKIFNDPELAALHVVALKALSGVDPNRAARLVVQRLASADSAQKAQPYLQSLLGQSGGSAALARALDKPQALPANVAKWVLKAINASGRGDAQLSKRLMVLAGMNPELPEYSKAYVTNLVKAVKTFGNAEEGKRVYEQAGCIACHMPGAPQSKIGPDLSAISRGMPIDMILTEVVWPGLNVKEGYEAATVTLNDGTVVTGFKETDTAQTISVRDMTTGEIREIAKAGTASIQTGGTVMPDGMTAGMDERQLAHLIRYLSELGQ
jgi:putative heme-binding domain-containing protein